MSRVTIALKVDIYADPVLCIAASAHTASKPTSHGADEERRLINSGTRFLSEIFFNIPLSTKI